MAWNWALRWMVSLRCAAWEENDSARAAGILLEKKVCCVLIREATAELTGRSDARKLSWLGTTGRLPVIMCPARKSEAATLRAIPVLRPKLSDGTPETPWRTRSLISML